MSEDPDKRIKFGIITEKERKDFIPIYMNYRVKTGSPGNVAGKVDTDGYLARFWREPSSNHLLWIQKGDERIGFVSVIVENTSGQVSDFHIFEKTQGENAEDDVIEELIHFSRYRGIKELRVEKGLNDLDELLSERGFEEREGFLVVSL